MRTLLFQHSSHSESPETEVELAVDDLKARHQNDCSFVGLGGVELYYSPILLIRAILLFFNENVL